MGRCKKSDMGDGSGCVCEAGHRGRHKIRSKARALYAQGPTSVTPLAARVHGAGSGRKGKGGQGGLDGLVAKIEREVAGLVADCGDCVRMLQEDAERSRKRNVLLLKFAIRSRQKISALKKRVAAARAETRAAVLSAETDATEDDEGDEGEDEA
jgi:hypothetical protein